MNYLILLGFILACVIIMFVIDKAFAQKLEGKKEENLKLENPDNKMRCPQCASFNIYEVLKKKPFTHEVIETNTIQHRCFDCNYTWKEDRKSI